MQMKHWKLKKIFALVMALVALAACQKRNDSVSISSFAGGPRFAANAATTSYAVGSLPGRIFADASQQAGFQDAAVGFLSTDMPPQYIGIVSAAGVGNSGIRFGGQVLLSTGSLRYFNGSYAEIDPRSQVVIQVFDQTVQYGQVAPIPPLRFAGATGTISGNQAQITFSDTFGSVTFQGFINTATNNFEGYASYDNAIRWDGSSPGAAGNFGNFSIPLCSFFDCH